MVRTQIQLMEQQARYLKSLVHERGFSMAEFIRHGVDKMLDTKE